MRLMIPIVLVSGLILYVIREDRKFLHLAHSITLFLLPLFFFVVGNVAWLVYRTPEAVAFANQPSASVLSDTENCVRVVLLVFDEMDQRLTFTARPAGVEL